MAAMAGTAANSEGKSYFKGQKTATTAGDITTVMDFGTQTVTIINNAQKTYKVQKFGDLNAAAGKMDVTADVKQTGQKKMINGFNATETLVTMDTGRRNGPRHEHADAGGDHRLDRLNVPGAGRDAVVLSEERRQYAVVRDDGRRAAIRAFRRRWPTCRKSCRIDGTPVEEMVHVKPAGGRTQMAMPAMPQMTPAQQAQMQAAMAKMQEMAKQPGPAGDAAKAQMANGARDGRNGRSLPRPAVRVPP